MDGMNIELKGVRKMVSDFKKTEEQSIKKQLELEAKVLMAKDET